MEELDIIIEPELEFSLKKCGDVVPYGITPEEKAKLAEYPELSGDPNKFVSDDGTVKEITSSIGVVGTDLYASVEPSTLLDGAYQLKQTIDPTETQMTIIAGGGAIVPGSKFIDENPAQAFPMGTVGFDYWRKISSLAGEARKGLRFFLFDTADNSETDIFAPLWSSPIEVKDFTERQISYSVPAVNPTATQHFGVEFLFTATGSDKTLTYIVGDGRGWFMRLPLPLKHKDITDKNSEAAFQHVDTTTVKNTLDAADMVAIKDSVTGKVVLTPKTQFAMVEQLAAKANHGYTTSPKTLKEVEDNPFVPIQMPAFYVYEGSKFRVQSVKSTHKLSGNFTHIKKYNAQISAVGSKCFIVKTADGKYSIAFYNAGYTTRIIVIKNGVTIYDLSQASSTWWPNQGVIIQRTIVDFDREKIIVSYGATNFEVSVVGLRAIKDIEFTDIELGINSYNSPCAYSVLIQGIPASDVDGTKFFSNLNTPSTSNLVDVVAPEFRISNVYFNFENGKVTFDYSTLSGLSTTGNTYTQHNYTGYRLFNISNIEQSQQEIFVRYSFDIDVENASVYFKSPTTTTFKRIRLVNRETFAVIDITTNLNNPFEVPVGKWNMVVSAIAKRQYEFGLLLGWGGCNSGAAMTIYQGHRIDPVSVVLSAYPRLASTQKAWCPYLKQFITEFVADFSNDII